jgi:hypothetical protein
MASFESLLAALRAAFASGADKYAAHERATPVLLEMAASPSVFTAILSRHLERVDALTMRHYPVVSLEIESNPHFGLVANCWIPLPDRDVDMSTKAIHHHGQMLLTTVTAFGPGYEHWLFTSPEMRDASSGIFSMRLTERAPHPTGHAAFVDANIGHVPFYPASLTVTLALWSSRNPTTWKDHLKRVPALHKHSNTLRDLAATIGLSRALDLKVVDYFDFSPTAEGFRGMKERQEFGRGPNEDYLYSLFHILQETRNDALGSAVRRRMGTAVAQNTTLVARLLADLDRGQPIAGRLSHGHYDIPFANFRGSDIERALGAGAARSPSVPRIP